MALTINFGAGTLGTDESDSDINDVIVRLDENAPVLSDKTATEHRLGEFFVIVEATSASALDTALIALKALFEEPGSGDVTVKDDSDTLYTLDRVTWPKLRVEYSFDVDNPTAIGRFTIVGYREDPVTATTANDNPVLPEGALRIVWQLEQGENGIQSAVATGTFGRTGSGDALAAAQAWAADFFKQPIEGLPAHLTSRLRPVKLTPVVEADTGDAEQNYGRATITVVFEAVYEGLGDIPAKVSNLNVGVKIVDEPIDSASGQQGLARLSLHGTFVIRTEYIGSALPGLLDPAPIGQGELLPYALTVYQRVEANFRNIYASFGLREFSAPRVEIEPTSGVCTFRREFVTGEILRWDENTYRYEDDQWLVSRTFKGPEFVNETEGGPVVTIEHELTIAALHPVAYRPPVLDINWKRVGQGRMATTTPVTVDGVVVYVTVGRSKWRYVNTGAGGLRSARDVYAAGPLTRDNIGQ